MNLHRCEITRARDTLATLTTNALRARMVTLQVTGEHAKRAMGSGGWDSVGGFAHDSNKGLARYTTTPEKSLNMCRRDWALTDLILKERLAG